MARPKGSPNKLRNEEKYWLPDGVILAPDQENYTKEQKLVFIDKDYGEFYGTFKHLQRSNASIHPKKVNERRAATNTDRYGGYNPHHSPAVRKKAKTTMLEKYGTEHALLNPELFKKSRDTLEANYGVRNMMDSPEIRETLRQVYIETYGVDNPMKVKEVVKKLSDNYFAKTGYTNPSYNPEVIEKIFATLIKNGNGSPSSKGEIEMLNFVKSFGLIAYKDYMGGAVPRELDIKIPEIKLAIEFNGAYWHQDRRGYHQQKTEIAAQKGYKLLQFFDFEWEQRNKQLKSFIRSALGKNEIKLNGRNTEIREVDKQAAKQFLNDYHILGAPNKFIKAIGLFYKEELVSMITIAKHHRNNDEIMLSRYVGKENITVRGGLNKLCKAAFNEFGVFSTFIDLRMSDGKAWLNNGWELITKSSCDYFYFDNKHNKVVSKQSRQKKKIGTPKNMTESEHAKKDGLWKIWDCGKLKLTYKGPILKK